MARQSLFKVPSMPILAMKEPKFNLGSTISRNVFNGIQRQNARLAFRDAMYPESTVRQLEAHASMVAPPNPRRGPKGMY